MKKNGKSLLKMVLLFAAMASFVLAGCERDINPGSLEYGTLSVKSSEMTDSSRAIYASEIAYAKATVTGYSSKGEKFTKNSALTAVSGGKGSGLKIESIPVCKNAVVTVQAYSDAGNTLIAGIKISAITDIKADTTTSVTVDWDTTKIGTVYEALLAANVNTNALTSDQVSSINNAIPEETHASLINASQIATDYKAESLGAASAYVLEAGSVKVTCYEYDGKTLQINDPLSSTATANVASSPVTISNVAPGTWTLYVLDGTTVKTTKTVSVTSEGTASVTLGTKTYDGIQIQVAKSLGYDQIHYWECSDTVNYPNTSWPGVKMLSDWCDDDYIYNFEGCSKVSLLITKDSGDKLCSKNISITAKGSYRITSSDASDSTYISNLPPEPTAPTVSIYPSNGSKIALNGSISVTFDDGNDTITSAKVTVNGTEYDMGTTAGTWTKSLSDMGIISEGVSVDVVATVTNSVGTGSDNASLTTKEASKLISNFNQLTIFQVMVSHFQDGDTSIGYTNAYGPSGQTYGGDLQGIINSLDYLQDLGVNALWMTPIFNSNSSSSGDQMGSTGYYTYDYFNIDPRFGTIAKFEELVEDCHERGINVILDGVFGHWGANVASSPNGKTPTRSHGQYKGCDYPASLDFFKEVAEYWIKNYKIDGWRLDQAYQTGARGESDGVYTGSTNYWPQIRATVESAAASNGTKGTDWGTLGYMVGEVLDGNQTNIQNWVVVNDGLKSCFDFPSRYKLCNAIVGGSDWADSAGSDTFVSAMTYTYNTYSTKGYTHSEGYYPNLFFSNHDLLRFGDLIIDWKGYSYGSDDYVGKYKVALASMAAYTGPITLYMGDEWGEATQGISLITATSTPVGKGAYWDNSSRTSGCITKATTGTAAEKDVLAYTKKLLSLRNDHEALWNGSSTVQSSSSSDLFVTKKVGGGETIYVGINNGTSSKTFSASGTDLISGQTYSGTVTVPALSAVYILAQ